MKVMEKRLADFEAFVAALPTWKEDLVCHTYSMALSRFPMSRRNSGYVNTCAFSTKAAKIDAVGRDSRLKTDQLLTKTTILEESMMHNIQATRERLDSLTALNRTSTEARAALATRIDGLEHSFREHEMASSVRLNDAEVAQRRESYEQVNVQIHSNLR
jgi:hypothetical protein